MGKRSLWAAVGTLALGLALTGAVGGGGRAAAAVATQTWRPGVSAANATTAKAPRCVVPTGKGPGYDASIGTGQNGGTFCVKTGKTLLVALSAPFKTARWSSIKAVPAGLLSAAPLTLMVTANETASAFKAVHPGTVQLSSTRPACAPAKPGHPTCMAIELWRVTLVVKKA